MKTVKIQVKGQYYWQDGRTKQVSAFGYDEKMFVDVPVSMLHKPLSFIQNRAINDLLKSRNPKATRFRTCEIVGDVPQPQGEYVDTPAGNDEMEVDLNHSFPSGPAIVPEPVIVDQQGTKEFPTNAKEVDATIELGAGDKPRTKQKAGKH